MLKPAFELYFVPYLISSFHCWNPTKNEFLQMLFPSSLRGRSQHKNIARRRRARNFGAIRKVIHASLHVLSPLLHDLSDSRLVDCALQLLRKGSLEPKRRTQQEVLNRSSTSLPHNDEQEGARCQVMPKDIAPTKERVNDSSSSAKRQSTAQKRKKVPGDGSGSDGEWVTDSGVGDEPPIASCGRDRALRSGTGLTSAPELFLPYQTQHLVLTEVQRVLEECCFDFAKKWLPEVVQHRKWHCPMAVELIKWASIIRKHAREIPASAMAKNMSVSSLVATLVKAHPIRHTAVHRVFMSVKGIGNLLKPAIRLALAMRDYARANHLEALKSQLDYEIRTTEEERKALKRDNIGKLALIKRQRQKLGEEKNAIRDEMTRTDREITERNSAALDDSIKRTLGQ